MNFVKTSAESSFSAIWAISILFSRTAPCSQRGEADAPASRAVRAPSSRPRDFARDVVFRLDRSHGDHPSGSCYRPSSKHRSPRCRFHWWTSGSADHPPKSLVHEGLEEFAGLSDDRDLLHHPLDLLGEEMTPCDNGLTLPSDLPIKLLLAILFIRPLPSWTRPWLAFLQPVVLQHRARCHATPRHVPRCRQPYRPEAPPGQGCSSPPSSSRLELLAVLADGLDIHLGLQTSDAHLEGLLQHLEPITDLHGRLADVEVEAPDRLVPDISFLGHFF